jgi:hypothetical protein
MDTSAAQDHYIRVRHLRNRTMTARDTVSNVPGLRRISTQTVRNRLRENGLRAWILIHRWIRITSIFAGLSPLLCCTIEPLQVHADVAVLCQSKDVWRVSRFHEDGFWLSVSISLNWIQSLNCFSILLRYANTRQSYPEHRHWSSSGRWIIKCSR